MVYIGDLKSQHQKQLQDLFDKLNKVEDEYAIQQEVISNFRTSIGLNNTELQTLKKRLKNSEKEKEEYEQLNKQIEEELSIKKESADNIFSILNEMKEKNKKNHAQVEELTLNIDET